MLAKAAPGNADSALKVLVLFIGVLIAWMFKPGIMNWYLMKKHQLKRKRALAEQRKMNGL